MKIINVLILAVFISGCANTAFTSRFERSGKLDLEGTSEIDNKADQMKWKDAEDIEVYVGELPESDVSEKGIITFENKKYIVLGKVTASPNPPGLLATNYPENEEWKSKYCPVNAVLTYGTLGLWQLTPFSYPCFIRDTNDIEDVNGRKERLVKTLKKSVKAANGDMLVITSLGHLEYRNNSGKVVDTTEMMHAEGIALKKVK